MSITRESFKLNKTIKVKNLIVVLFALLSILGLIFLISPSTNNTDEGEASIGTGIEGFVMNVSECPAGTEDEDGGCNTERVKANIIVKNKRDEIIQEIETSDDGSFSLELKPGKYAIYSDSGGLGQDEFELEYVTVENGSLANITINVNTNNKTTN
ncbi:MAG: hypothetical protein AAB736_02000 [Patescibacteria group bacterium]